MAPRTPGGSCRQELRDDNVSAGAHRGPRSRNRSNQFIEKLQREVNNRVNSIKDDELCVAGDKSKLLVEGTDHKTS